MWCGGGIGAAFRPDGNQHGHMNTVSRFILYLASWCCGVNSGVESFLPLGDVGVLRPMASRYCATVLMVSIPASVISASREACNGMMVGA